MYYDYRCISSSPTPTELDAHTSYGIAASLRDSVIAVIPDITTDQDRLESLTHLCNKFHLDPVHLFDVIEDFLADF